MGKCPILQAGSNLYSVFFHGNQERGQIEIAYNREADCLAGECEWFNNGCPAHPGSEEQKQIKELAELIHRALQTPGFHNCIPSEDCIQAGYRAATEKGPKT